MSDPKQQPVQYYDLKAAREHGISDADILKQLAQTHNYDLAGAREHGISDEEILNTLVTAKPPAEPVVEKESPEMMGGIGATTGAVAAAGDIIYSKGRPLIRMAEKAMGREPSAPVAKPRTFLDPSTVAQQAIDRRTVTEVPEGSTTTVRNWTVGKPGEGTGQHAGEFLGGANYKEANKIAEAALETQKQVPGHKVLPGSLLVVPEEESKRLAQQRAELAAQEDVAKQAEVRQVAQKRAERLGERSALKQKQTKFDVTKGTAGILGKAAMPIVGGYEAGSQGAQAYNRLTRPDMTASDVASGAANVVGAGAGALSMVPSKYRIPAAIIAQGAGAVANWLDKRNPREEPVVEQKAAGGLAGYAGGKKVIAEKAAKKAEELVKGYLHHTTVKPNNLVGTRFKTTDTGGLITPYEFDPSKYMGAKIIHRPYDLSSRNQLVEEVSGHKLDKPFKTSGGQPFGRDIELQKAGIGGASNEEFNARILDRVDAAAKEGNGQVLNIPSSMSFGSEAFSTMPINIQLDLLKQRELPPETIAQLNAEMRNFDPKKFQNFLGFEHPELQKQLLEGGYDLGTTPGQLRKHLAQRLGTKANQKLLDYNVEDLYHAIRDPQLRNTPPGHMGLTVMEAQPFAPAFGPGYHDAYNAGDASKYVGEGINAPISLWMPDTYKEALARIKAGEKTAGKPLSDQRGWARNVLGTQQSGVAQTMNQQVVDNLGRYKEAIEAGKIDPNNLDQIHQYIYGTKAPEYAQGGAIDGYADGKSVMPDVNVSARNIPNMTGMPGVGYMQTPQGAMARLQMEKELEEARIRAGVSGMAMSIPGQQGVKTMPGQMDIGANIPVGRGNLDISANRSINPIPGRGHMQGVNARYTMPFAQGGEVQHFANGKIVLAKELAKRMILPPAENAARTQIIGTLPTYAKAADVLAQRGAGGTGIDVGAGLGKGAEVLASKLGKDVRTMEPYAQKWSPDYSSAEQMPSDAHGFLTNLNVLNVMPREARDELVQHIGRTMEPGGLGVLTTRGADVMKAQGRPGPEPMSMITSRDTYQKGFTNQELEDYLKYMLGQGYDINKLNLGPAGALIKKK
jgi:hypothetical protein